MTIPDAVPWLLWRLVLAKIATLHEVETHYSLADVVIANLALDVQDAAERKASADARGR